VKRETLGLLVLGGLFVVSVAVCVFLGCVNSDIRARAEGAEKRALEIDRANRDLEGRITAAISESGKLGSQLAESRKRAQDLERRNREVVGALEAIGDGLGELAKSISGSEGSASEIESGMRRIVERFEEIEKRSRRP
jgi:septal ring factor EnvC (AmiA/AmiB activator)